MNIEKIRTIKLKKNYAAIVHCPYKFLIFFFRILVQIANSKSAINIFCSEPSQQFELNTIYSSF
jgi:hypothetical protein